MKAIINNKEYELVVAKTEEEKENGLQNVEEMQDNEGMLFDYRDDPQQDLSFWMKDTTIPLDIIFVGEDDVVLSVKHGIPESEELLTEEGETYYVIELNQNSGVNPGDEIDLQDDELQPNKMYVLNQDGSVQFELEGGERIISRKETKVLIRKAKKAFAKKTDSLFKDLGKYFFKILDGQDSRDPEYVNARDNDK